MTRTLVHSTQTQQFMVKRDTFSLDSVVIAPEGQVGSKNSLCPHPFHFSWHQQKGMIAFHLESIIQVVFKWKHLLEEFYNHRTSLVTHSNQKYLFVMKPLSHLVTWSRCFSKTNFLVTYSPRAVTRKRVTPCLPLVHSFSQPPHPSQLLQGFWDPIGLDKGFSDIEVYKMESCAPSPYKLSLEVPLR